MTIQEILKSANYPCKGDNRNNAIRSINAVLKNSKITIEVCESGKVWTMESGFKSNLRIRLAGVLINRSKQSDMNPYNILKKLAKFLREAPVNQAIYAEVSIPHKCHKCEGTGFLPEFAWYADGVCFDCMGCGMTGVLIVNNVQDKKELKGMPYLNRFWVSACYDEMFPARVENVQVVSHASHETAITYLGFKDGMYYIHQPICRANSWYAFPETESEKFKSEWERLFNFSLEIYNHTV